MTQISKLCRCLTIGPEAGSHEEANACMDRALACKGPGIGRAHLYQVSHKDLQQQQQQQQ